jgi:hypothetical protein
MFMLLSCHSVFRHHGSKSSYLMKAAMWTENVRYILQVNPSLDSSYLKTSITDSGNVLFKTYSFEGAKKYEVMQAASGDTITESWWSKDQQVIYHLVRCCRGYQAELILVRGDTTGIADIRYEDSGIWETAIFYQGQRIGFTKFVQPNGTFSTVNHGKLDLVDSLPQLFPERLRWPSKDSF